MNKLGFYILTLIIAGAVGLPSRSFADDKSKKASLEDELRLKSGDEAGNELKSLKAELLISRTDGMALDQLQKLLKKYKGTAMEASLEFRLAELYIRRAKTATFFEVNRDDSNAVRFTPMATNNASTKVWIAKAVNTYDDIEHRFTHFRDMDLVLFNNAFARQAIGQDKEAIQRYKKVIEDYSESPLVPDCHLAIGEYLFTSKEFQASYDEFQKIRQTPEARVYPYGLYKGSWSLYNLHRTADALKQLEEVIAYSKTPSDEGGHLDLTKEALDDMVLFFEDVHSPSDAVAYFRTQGGDTHAGDLVLKLGKLYERHGRLNNMEVVFNQLIKEVPSSPERVQMHRDLMDSYEVTKHRPEVIVQLDVLNGLCQENSGWSKLQSVETKDECWKQLEEAGKIYASKWHKEYKKNPNPELADLTAQAYESMLRNNNRIMTAEDRIRFNYAELLFQRGTFRKAIDQYSRVAHVTKDPKLVHDASYAALVSLEKAVGDGDKWSDADERQFALLAADYITLNPKGQYITDVKFKKAFIAYEKGHYDEAAPQLKDLAMHFFSIPRGLKAAHLYLDILNLQKKYALLRDESQMFVAKFKPDAQTRADFWKIHQQAGFTVVQDLEAAKKYPEAVKGYLAFAKEDPQSVLADKAMYNAVRCANLGGDLASAAKISEDLLEQYPNSTYRNELAHSLVVLYEAQAQLGLAARTLVRLADWEKDKASSYLLSGADYKALNNDWSEANQIYIMLSQKYPKTPEGALALERLEALAEKNSQWDRAEKLLQQMVESGVQPQASLASFKIAKHVYDAGDEEKAFKLAKKVVAMRKEDHVSNYALAQSRLIQAKILEKEFEAASVKARPERLSIVLGIKTEKLSNTQKAYQDVIGFGDKATAIEALVRLANCYGKFSEALSRIEAPADAPAADQKKFLAEIENLAMPIEEKNADTLQVALKQAKNLGLHDDSVAKIQGELNRMAKKNTKGKNSVDIATPENVYPVIAND